MIPHSVAYLEMFLQSVRNGAAPSLIPSDDILTEKIFCDPERHGRLNHAFEFFSRMVVRNHLHFLRQHTKSNVDKFESRLSQHNLSKLNLSQ